MSNERRRQRSVRIVAAVLVLLAAAVLVTVAVVVASQALLVVAALGALLAGCVAARIVNNELAQTRREWARDRAQQAKAYEDILAARTREQARFAADMSKRVADRDSRIVELKGTVRLADARADEAGRRVNLEKKRNAELQDRVASLLTEKEALVDRAALEAESAEASTIVDLMRWEQDSSGLDAPPRDERKQA